MAEVNSHISQELNKTHPKYANYLNVMYAEMSCILCILPDGSPWAVLLKVLVSCAQN